MLKADFVLQSDSQHYRCLSGTCWVLVSVLFDFPLMLDKSRLQHVEMSIFLFFNLRKYIKKEVINQLVTLPLHYILKCQRSCVYLEGFSGCKRKEGEGVFSWTPLPSQAGVALDGLIHEVDL